MSTPMANQKISWLNTLQVATPIIMSSATLTIGAFISMLLMSKISPNALAASGMIYTFYGLLSAAAYSILSSTVILYGQKIGQKCTEELPNVFVSSLFVAISISVVMFIAMRSIGIVLSITHQPEQIIPEVSEYFHILSWSCLPQCLILAYTQLFIGVGKPKYALYISLYSMPPSLVLGTLMAYGIGFSTPFGIAGFAYASLIITYLTCFVLMRSTNALDIFEKKPMAKRLSGIQIRYTTSILKLGINIALQRVGEILALTTLTFMAGYLGIQALAAQHVAQQYLFLVLLVPMGLSQTNTALIGQLYGTRNIRNIKKQHRVTLSICLLFNLVVITTYFVAGKNLIHFYAGQYHNEHFFQLAYSLLLISGLFQVIDGIRSIYSSTLIGMGDTFSPMYIGLATFWLLALPISYYAGILHHQGILAIRLSLVLAVTIGVLLTRAHLKRQFLTLKNELVLSTDCVASL